jgi:hypothetical protein
MCRDESHFDRVRAKSPHGEEISQDGLESGLACVRRRLQEEFHY